MRNYYIFIIGLISFVCLLIIAGFATIGTPFDQQATNLDQKRIENFREISYSIDTYAQKNGALPPGLSQLIGVRNTKDPKTNTEYIYQSISTSSYSLCTTFSTDTFNTTTNSDLYSYSTSTKHKKGYDCITYTIPTTYLKQLITPTPELTIKVPSAEDRDYQRKNDLNSMQAFITTYKREKGNFPQSLSQIVGQNYLPRLPMDPLTYNTYTYSLNQNSTDYNLCAAFELITQKCINSSNTAWDLK